jgi:hypothetical protein
MANVQKNAITDYNVPSSEPFRLHLTLPLFYSTFTLCDTTVVTLFYHKISENTIRELQISPIADFIQ